MNELLRVAGEALDRDDLKAAATLYHEAAKDTETAAGAEYGLALVAMKRGNIDEGRRLLEQSLEHDQGSANAHYYLAVILKTVDRSASEAHRREALRLDPEHAAARQLEHANNHRPPESAASPARDEPAASAKGAGQTDRVVPPRIPSPGSVVGVVLQALERVEAYGNNAYGLRVYNLLVQLVADGKPGETVGVEMRGTGRTGFVDKGHWIEIPAGTPRSGDGYVADQLRDLTTGEEIRTRGVGTVLDTGSGLETRRALVRRVRRAAIAIVACAAFLVAFGVIASNLGGWLNPPDRRLSVPSVTGADDPATAEHQLDQAGFTNVDLQKVSSTKPPNTVLGTVPAAGASVPANGHIQVLYAWPAGQ